MQAWARYIDKVDNVTPRRELIPTTAFAPLRSACLLVPRANLAPKLTCRPNMAN